MICTNFPFKVPINHLGSATFTCCLEISGALAEQSSVQVQNNPNLYLYITYVPCWLGLQSGVYAGVYDP